MSESLDLAHDQPQSATRQPSVGGCTRPLRGGSFVPLVSTFTGPHEREGEIDSDRGHICMARKRGVWGAAFGQENSSETAPGKQTEAAKPRKIDTGYAM